MPLNPNPYKPFLDAMQAQQGQIVPGSEITEPDPATYHDPSGQVGLNSMLDQRKTELERNLELTKGDPSFHTGGTYADLRSIMGDMAPMEKQRQETEATNAANTSAIQAGFGGTKDIATDYTGGVKPASEGGDISTAMAAGDGQSPVQRQAASGRMAELAKLLLPGQVKAQGDLAVEHEKNLGMQQLDQQNFDRIMGARKGAGFDGSAPGSPAPPSSTSPPARGAGAPQAAGAAPTSQSWADFIMGKGPNSLRSAADAANERLKYGVMSTPYAPLMQDVSFANLQQLSGQFPTVRGFGYLLPLLAQHQANVGKGESWDATYQRLQGMDKIMGDTTREFDDPSLSMKMGPTGRIEMGTPPQTVMRGKLALQDAHTRIKDAMRQLEQLHPEILQGGQPGAQGGGGGKTIVDEQGNLIQKGGM